jgi:hypothetical protein
MNGVSSQKKWMPLGPKNVVTSRRKRFKKEDGKPGRK